MNLFTSKFRVSYLPKPVTGLYPEGKAMQPADGTPPIETQTRAKLVAFVKGAPNAKATLALFDRAAVKAKLADPTLRAALAFLEGTIAKPVVDNFLGRTYSGPPRFCNCLPNPIVVGAATGSGTTAVIRFSGRYQSEHFALFSGILAHEILHQRAGSSTPAEEVVLNLLTGLVHMQIVARHPELATSGTELSRYMNTWLIILLNSRLPGKPQMSVVAPKGMGTVPGSALSKPDLWSHAPLFHPLGNAANPTDVVPAPAVLASVLRPVLRQGAPLPKPLTFGLKTAQALSPLNDTWLSTVERLRLNVLLGLVSVDEIVKLTGRPRAEVISAFRLAPILAAQ